VAPLYVALKVPKFNQRLQIANSFCAFVHKRKLSNLHYARQNKAWLVWQMAVGLFRADLPIVIQNSAPNNMMVTLQALVHHF
jgi:hypothetical protein